jgi:hypothetical protein
MNLPNYQTAIIPSKKLTHYLLCSDHSTGGSKARFFLGQGFSLQNWHELQRGLQEIVKDYDVVKTEESPFGMRYVVDGKLSTPKQRSVYIRTVWFIEHGETVPYFVTAYPQENRDD